MGVTGLRSLALEVADLDRAAGFYAALFGLGADIRNRANGEAVLRLNDRQALRLWVPLTRRPSAPRPELNALGARGSRHVHYALQIPRGTLDHAKEILDRRRVRYELHELDPGDVGIYFFDPDGHGLELREVAFEGPARGQQITVAGFREVVLEFPTLDGVRERLEGVYGLPFGWEGGERAFLAFSFTPGRVEDSAFNPHAWLYCWDPQIGLALMQGGEHAFLTVGVDDPRAVMPRVEAAGLPAVETPGGVAVRDPAGHVFEFVR